LVVDDGSRDQEQVRNIVEKFQKIDGRISYLELPKNFGKWYALNEAISKTSCELITTLDADDICLPERIARQIAVFHAVPGTLHVLTSFWHCWSESELYEKMLLKVEGPLKIVSHDDTRNLVLIGKNSPGINHYFTGNIETAGASAMFHRSIWDLGIRFNPPRTGLRVLLSEDSDFNFRVTALLGRTAILDEKLYCYRRNTSTNEEAV
jgi:glycosyltransferase involved in cell wall biosynthesis